MKYNGLAQILTGAAGAAMLLAVPAPAQSQPVMSGGVERLSHTIIATGLSPAFPASYRCEPIASPYGSPTRYDGSRRRDDRNEGLHGGMDLTLRDGTPLLAVAAGEVLATGEGGRLEGIFIWLRHVPADSGLPFFVFTKYQHLSRLPALKPGDRVRAGEVVGLSGNTGTAGPHYGAAGYPHLHLTTRYGPVGEYELRGAYQSMVMARDSVIGDPLQLYRTDLKDLDSLSRLPEERKVTVGVVDNDGKPYPADTLRVWPVGCSKR